MKKISIGDTFGDFIIDSRNYKIQQEKQANATYWNVYCKNCGKIKILRGDAIRNNPKCDCQYRNREKGKIYGDWEILEPVDQRSKDKCIIYRCRCIYCKHEDFLASNILRSNRKHCSMCYVKETSLIDLTGYYFGYLEVLYRDTSNQHMGRKKDAYWICKCHNCGTIKSIRGFSLRHGFTRSCGCIKSYGETRIAQLLTQNCILFKKEYKFSDLYFQTPNAKLSFDFAIFNKDNSLKCLIEYDGQQHFEEGVCNRGWNTYDNFLLVHQRDLLKNQYCTEHNLFLIRIKYSEPITLNKILGLEPTEGGSYGTK